MNTGLEDSEPLEAGARPFSQTVPVEVADGSVNLRPCFEPMWQAR